MTYNIVDTRRFHLRMFQGEINVILTDDTKRKHLVAYMGTSRNNDEIVEYGAELTKEQAEAFFGVKMPDYKKGKDAH